MSTQRAGSGRVGGTMETPNLFSGCELSNPRMLHGAVLAGSSQVTSAGSFAAGLRVAVRLRG
jgi:hypothetical protein